MTISFEFIRLYGPYRLSTTKCTRHAQWCFGRKRAALEIILKSSDKYERDNCRYTAYQKHSTNLKSTPKSMADK